MDTKDAAANPANGVSSPVAPPGTGDPAALYETLLLNAPVGFAFVDRDFRYVRVNEALGAIHAVRTAEMLGKTVAEVIPQLRPELEPLYRRALAGETILNHDVDCPSPDGDGAVRSWMVSCYPAIVQGEVIGIGVIVNDLTTRKQAENALSIRSDLYAMLSRTNQAVSQCTSSEELFAEICRIAVETGRFRFAWIGVPDGNRVRLVASAGNDSGYMKEIVITLDEADPRSHGPTGRAAKTGQSYIANDFMSSTMTVPWQESAKRAGFAASAAFPLRQDTRVVAVLTLYAGLPGFFTDKLVSTLGQIAPAVELALDRFVRDQERRQTTAALQASEERLRLALLAGRMGIYDWDVQTGAIVWSDSHYELFGYPPGDCFPIQFHHFADRIHPDDRASVEHWIQESIETRTVYKHEYRVVHPDKAIVWVMGSGGFIYDADQRPLRMLGTIVDITDLKQAEAALRASEERYRVFVDNAMDAFFLHDSAGRIRDVNPVACESLGYAREELIGRTPVDLDPDVTASRLQELADLLDQGTPATFETRHRRKDGTIVPVEVKLRPFQLRGERHSIAIVRDITARKQADAVLRDSEAQLRTVLEGMPVLLDAFDERGAIVAWNRECERVTGYAAAEMVGNPRAMELLYPDTAYREQMYAEWTRRGNNYYQWEWDLTCKDGSVRTISWSNISESLPVPGWSSWGIGFDVTEQKQQEQERRESDNRLRTIIASIPGSVYRSEVQPPYRDLFLSEGICFITGYESREYFAPGGPTCGSLILPEDLPGVEAAVQVALAKREPFQIRYRVRHRDGSIRWVQEQGNATFSPDGTPLYLDGVHIDVTAEVAAEAAIRESEALFRGLFESPGVLRGIVELVDGDVIHLRDNASSAAFFGHSQEEARGRRASELGIDPETIRIWTERYRESQRAKGPVQFEHQMPGSSTWFWATVFPLPGDQDPGNRFVYVALDISHRKRDETDLRIRDRAVQASSQGIVITDPALPDNPIIYASPGFERLSGYKAAEIMGRNCRFLQGSQTDPAALEQIRQAVRDGSGCTVELLNYRKDGTPFWNNLTISPVKDPNGRISQFVGVQTDVTERRSLEEQFRQAQKMEAVGQLAGGIAHDFNNLITIIAGHTHMLIDAQPVNSTMLRSLGEILKATDRSASLTQQLLAFSRKQLLAPRILDLNQVILGTEAMLRRLIGEDVNLVVDLSPSLESIRADPGQVEQVLTNLVINARNAMPKGGRLTIQTRNVVLSKRSTAATEGLSQGRYVVLSLADSGIGMSPDIRNRIFEPFFTTDQTGKGTGLGLSVVHGIVAQSGGQIQVDTEPGAGTCFTLWFPRSSEPAEMSRVSRAISPVRHGDETVLLVEDEEALRSMARRVLEQYGYVILESPNADEALRWADKHKGPIHLLLTDVVMPRMGGRELAEQILAIRPEVKVLYMSGYMDDVVVRQGIEYNHVHFLRKPFTPIDLARKVRDVLQNS